MRLYAYITVINEIECFGLNIGRETTPAVYEQLEKLVHEFDGKFLCSTLFQGDKIKIDSKILNISILDNYLDIPQLMVDQGIKLGLDNEIDLPNLIKFLNDKQKDA